MARHLLVIAGWLPPTLNQLTRGKRRARIRGSREARNMVAAFRVRQDVAKATGKRRVSADLYYPPGRRRPDVDATQKVLLDACKQCGLLVNDSPVWCELGPWQLWRGEMAQTELTFEDL